MCSSDLYTPKAAYHAFAHLAALFDAACRADNYYAVLKVDWALRQTGALPFLAPVVGTFARNEYPLYAYYYPEDLQRGWPGMTPVTLEVVGQPDGLRRLEHPVLIDALSGKLYRIADVEENANGYLELRRLPLTDYPLLVTDEAAVDRVP